MIPIGRGAGVVEGPVTEAGRRVLSSGVPMVPSQASLDRWTEMVLRPEVLRIEAEAAQAARAEVIAEREPVGLDAAWARVEATLPDGWIGPILEPKYTYHGKIVVVDYQAAARNDAALGVAPTGRIGRGPTPIDALDSLADQLALLPPTEPK